MQVFESIIMLTYFILITVIIYTYIKYKSSGKKSKSVDSEIINNITDTTPLDLIRNQYFPDAIFIDTDFFINSYMVEVFNIFLRLSPSIISTLTKVERRMVALKVLIDNPMEDENSIKEEIDTLDCILNELVKASHSMIEKLESHLLQVGEQTEYSKIKLNRDMAQAYMNAVNILMDLTENHSVLNYEIHARLVSNYPELIEPFRIISGKITYLFFVNLISYSYKIDQNVFINDK